MNTSLCWPLFFAAALAACQSPPATAPAPAPGPAGVVSQWAAAPGFPGLRVSPAVDDLGQALPGGGHLLEVLTADGRVLDTVVVRGLVTDAPLRLHRGEPRDYMRHSPDIVQADINGDSFPDLLVRTGQKGSYGGPSFHVFLRDQRTGRHRLSEGLTRLGEGRTPLGYEDGFITTGAKDGCCLHVRERYRIEDECIRLVDRTTMDSRDRSSPTKVTVEQGGTRCE